MATVADLVAALDDNLMAWGPGFDTTHLPGGTDAAEKKIRALNRGQHRVWKAILAGSRRNRANWFGSIYSGAVSTASSIVLPSNCHDVLFVDSNTPSLQIKPSSWANDEWQKARQDKTSRLATDIGTLYYLVSGAYQPTLYLSHTVTSLTLNVHYTGVLADFVDANSVIDQILAPYRDAIVNYATAVLVAATRDVAGARFWMDLWMEDRDLIMGVVADRKANEPEFSRIDLQR